MSEWIIEFVLLAFLLAILATLAWAFIGPPTIPIMAIACFSYGAMFAHKQNLEDKP